MQEFIRPKDTPSQGETPRDVNHTLHKDPATVEKINALKESLTPPTYTPEESAQEKDRILGLLKDLRYDDAVRNLAQATIRNKYVPKELVMFMAQASHQDGYSMRDAFRNEPRMTLEDREALMIALVGGKSVLREFARILLLPTTVVDFPTGRGEVQKISGEKFLLWLLESKELAQKYGMDTTTQTQQYTPEESAQEKNRILGLLDSMKSVGTMRDIAQAAIRDKHVPKELIMSMMRAFQTDGDMMVSILKNESRMTLEDQEAIVSATIGGESVLRELIRVAPETTVELMNAEGTEIETVPLTSMLLWLAPSKELAQKYGMDTAGVPTQTTGF